MEEISLTSRYSMPGLDGIFKSGVFEVVIFAVSTEEIRVFG